MITKGFQRILLLWLFLLESIVVGNASVFVDIGTYVVVLGIAPKTKRPVLILCNNRLKQSKEETLTLVKRNEVQPIFVKGQQL
jgi:hypothetical protein